VSASSPLLAAYKGPAGADVLMFAKLWSQASGRPLRVVTIYPGAAPISMARVDAEWVAYNREEAHDLLDEARSRLGTFDAEFEAIGSDSASHGLHDVQEAAGSDSIVILGSLKTRGVRRTAPGNTAERLLHGAPGPVAIVPWDYEAGPVGPIRRLAVAYVDTEDGHAALVAAGHMALELKAELQLVTVVPDTRVTPAMGEPSVYRGEERESFEGALKEASGHLPEGLVWSTRLLGGPVVDALADLRPQDADVLVCGSRGYGPARRVLLGGVSSRLLRHARLPVIVVPRR
jgi:nucleotide-binding universal stress UspA family protein